jgi:hypothetical protein
MAKTITEGFQTFLSRIQPLPGERSKAITHKDSVKSCVENNFKCYSMFETGSFGNATGVRHFSDTDYFAPIPVDILTDSSSYFLRKLKEAFQHTFWKTTGIEVNSPAVVIPFGQYASEDIEVTPCNFKGMVTTSLGNYPRYLIPDGNGVWMAASPQAHNAYVKAVDSQLRYKLKPLIQFIKAWKFFNDAQIVSFYLELRITKLLENSVVLSYDETILKILNHLNDVQLADMRDPMGISGLIPSSKTVTQKNAALSKLNTALSRAEKACNAREKGNVEDAFKWWSLFYNNEFPAR